MTIKNSESLRINPDDNTTRDSHQNDSIYYNSSRDTDKLVMDSQDEANVGAVCCSCELLDYPLSIQDGAQTFTRSGTRKCTIFGILVFIIYSVYISYDYISNYNLQIQTRNPISNVDYIDIHKLRSQIFLGESYLSWPGNNVTTN